MLWCAQILAQRIEDALARGLPLDGLTGDKHVIPEHMRCVIRHITSPECSQIYFTVTDSLYKALLS